MANDKTPSYQADDQGITGSELDQYGVWVKSDPAEDGADDDLDFTIPEAETLPDFGTEELDGFSADDLEIPVEENLEDMRTELIPEDLEPITEDLDSLSFDNTLDPELDNLEELQVEDILKADPDFLTEADMDESGDNAEVPTIDALTADDEDVEQEPVSEEADAAADMEDTSEEQEDGGETVSEEDNTELFMEDFLDDTPFDDDESFDATEESQEEPKEAAAPEENAETEDNSADLTAEEDLPESGEFASKAEPVEAPEETEPVEIMTEMDEENLSEPVEFVSEAEVELEPAEEISEPEPVEVTEEAESCEIAEVEPVEFMSEPESESVKTMDTENESCEIAEVEPVEIVSETEVEPEPAEETSESETELCEIAEAELVETASKTEVEPELVEETSELEVESCEIAEAEPVETESCEIAEAPPVEKTPETVDETTPKAPAQAAEPSLATDLLMRIAEELSSIRQELSHLKQDFLTSHISTAPAEASVEEQTKSSGGFFDDSDDEKIALSGDELDNILLSADFTEETGEDASVEDTAELADEVLLDPSKDSEELRRLREEGVEPITSAPEDTSYLEIDPLTGQEETVEEESFDLSDVVIDEPDLSAEVYENPLKEPALEDISFDDQDMASELAGMEEISDEICDEIFEDESIPELEEEEEPEIVISEPEESPAQTEEESVAPEQKAAPFPENKPVAEQAPAKSLKEIPSSIQQELKTVLSYMDQLLESLPEEKIEEFAASPYFDTYKKLFTELGLV